MILITGGAWQGKLEYAKKIMEENTDKDEWSIFDCRGMLGEGVIGRRSMELDAESTDFQNIDLSADIIDHLEAFTLYCAEHGLNAVDLLSEHENEFGGSIVICADISSGVVPMDPTQRAWREINGRTMTWLSQHAEKVIRMFCGIPQELKSPRH